MLSGVWSASPRIIPEQRMQQYKPPAPNDPSLQRPSPRLDRRLQRWPAGQLEFRVRRAVDRDRPAGGRGAENRRNAPLGRAQHEGDQRAASGAVDPRPFPQGMGNLNDRARFCDMGEFLSF